MTYQVEEVDPSIKVKCSNCYQEIKYRKNRVLLSRNGIQPTQYYCLNCARMFLNREEKKVKDLKRKLFGVPKKEKRIKEPISKYEMISR